MELKTKNQVKVQDSLLTIPVGGVSVIKTKDIKASSIRSAVGKLNKKGYQYTHTERDLINEVRVTRIA
jgi:hypothetical protein